MINVDDTQHLCEIVSTFSCFKMITDAVPPVSVQILVKRKAGYRMNASADDDV